MTFTRFLLTASRAISKGFPTMKGCQRAIAICFVGLLGAVPPARLQAAETPLAFDTSITIGPLATRLNITQPVAQTVTTPTDGSAVVYHSTLHLHVQDDTQTPAFNADLVSTGQAADPDTLVGGFLPAAICVQQDLLAGMTFRQAVTDCQAKTAVTVTFFEDATMVEYALLIGAIALILVGTVENSKVAPTLGDQLATIHSKMAAALTAIGVTPPSSCVPIPTTTP